MAQFSSVLRGVSICLLALPKTDVSRTEGNTQSWDVPCERGTQIGFKMLLTDPRTGKLIPSV